MENCIVCSTGEYEFWREVGEEWAQTPDLRELLSILNQKSLPGDVHKNLLGYSSKEEMMQGFLAGVVKYVGLG
jgi:translation elongation factor EF-G